MMVDSTVITPAKGEELIAKYAKETNMTEAQYLEEVANKCYVIVKDSKTGLKVATWENGEPEIFNRYSLANEELSDKEYIDIAYKGYRIMTERAYWDAIGATEIYSLVA